MIKKKSLLTSLVLVIALLTLSISAYAAPAPEVVKVEFEQQHNAINTNTGIETTALRSNADNGNASIQNVDDIGPFAVYYINNSVIGAESSKTYSSPTGNAFNLTKGKKVDYDLTWFVRNDLTVALYDVDTGKIHNSKNIKNGSATGSIKVPHDGKYYFYIYNKGDTSVTVNGSVDL